MRAILRFLGLSGLLGLTACAGDLFAPPVNVPGDSRVEVTRPLPRYDSRALEETSITLAFSGGGMRASAFSYGVLEAMHETKLADKPLTDAVEVVTGVSGGSVTAAFYAWKGEAIFDEFRTAFLDKNAESGLSSDVSISNVVRLLTFGGVNDNSAFPRWLNKNVFHDATYADLPGHPILWISASDIINRTPFVFSGLTFRPLCSDLSKVKLADAVAASAAVPGAFTPINIESFADRCEWAPAPRNEKAFAESYELQATADAMHNYRDNRTQKYIKLLDGGLTDNFGVQGLAQLRLAQHEPYAPLHPERAVRLKRVLLMVVNSGRGPVKSEMGLHLAPPGALELAGMVTDTAVDANTHATYDMFRLVMADWQRSLVEWRCAQPEQEVRRLLGREDPSWKCNDVQFYVTQVSFGDTGAEDAAKLNVIPTRFVLEKEQIDFLLASARRALANDATYQEFLGSLRR